VSLKPMREEDSSGQRKQSHYSEVPCNNLIFSPAFPSNGEAILNSMTSLGRILGVELLDQYTAPLSPPTTDVPADDLSECFRSFPAHLDKSDIDYARDKGALEIPCGQFRDEIVRCYVEYVHWYMPVVDLEALLLLLASEDGSHAKSDYSLLLFQCIMFAGVGFVDEALVKEEGHENLKLARKCFYQRAKVSLTSDGKFDRSG
jgi:hypothetical protein